MGACLESPPPLPLLPRTLEHSQWGQEVWALASQLPGWDATELGQPAQRETEAPLSLLSGLAGTIATLRTRNIGQHACPGSRQAAAGPPAPASPNPPDFLL